MSLNKCTPKNQVLCRCLESYQKLMLEVFDNVKY